MMKLPLSLAITCLLSCVLGAGCGSAQLLRGDADGGEVMLTGSYMPAVAEARAVMAEHCGGRFVVYADGNAQRRTSDAPSRGQERAAFVCVEGHGASAVAKAEP